MCSESPALVFLVTGTEQNGSFAESLSVSSRMEAQSPERSLIHPENLVTLGAAVADSFGGLLERICLFWTFQHTVR